MLTGRTYVRLAENPLYEIVSGLRAQGLTLSCLPQMVRNAMMFRGLRGTCWSAEWHEATATARINVRRPAKSESQLAPALFGRARPELNCWQWQVRVHAFHKCDFDRPRGP